jgi:hypothetical protein
MGAPFCYCLYKVCALLRFSYCLAPKPSSHLRLGPHEVGHEGVATGRRDFILRSIISRKQVFDSFAPAVTRRKGNLASTIGVELSWASPLFFCLTPRGRPHLSFRFSIENKFPFRIFQHRCRPRMPRSAFLTQMLVYRMNDCRAGINAQRTHRDSFYLMHGLACSSLHQYYRCSEAFRLHVALAF